MNCFIHLHNFPSTMNSRNSLHFHNSSQIFNPIRIGLGPHDNVGLIPITEPVISDQMCPIEIRRR